MIDWAQALDMTGGDESLLAEVIEVFQQEAPSLMAAMRDAIDSRDTKLLHRAAHTLKNSLLSLGATRERRHGLRTRETCARRPVWRARKHCTRPWQSELPLSLRGTQSLPARSAPLE